MPLQRNYQDNNKMYNVTFELPLTAASEDEEIRVVGDFNQWNWDNAPSLSKTATAYQVDLELEPRDKYEYRYLINNQYWVNDKNADDYIPSPCDDVDNCVLKLAQPINTSGTHVSSPSLRRRIVDFTKIKGITLDVKIKLNKAGIRTYRQLADTTVGLLSTILNEKSFMFTPATYYHWIDMADQMDEEEW